MRKSRDAWILGVLLLVFVVALAFFSQNTSQEEAKQRPSSYNVTRTGARALYDLLGRQGISTRRLEVPIADLPPDAGLLIMIEPFERPMEDAEVASLQKWLNKGGTLLLVASDGVDGVLSNLSFEEAKAVPHAEEKGAAEVSTHSPYAKDVDTLTIAGEASIAIQKPEKVEKLVTTDSGVYGVTWREEKGRVILLSDAVGLNNQVLQAAPLDNPVFFVNIAQESTGKNRPVVLFDEYHQGFGERKAVGTSFWGALGSGMRAAAWYVLFGFVLLVVVLNRRFGTVKSLPIESNRPSTEYIASMASLYQRSGAGVLAIEAILREFLRELASRLEMDVGSDPGVLAEAAQRRLGWNAAEVASTIRRCGELIATPGPATRTLEQEFTQLAQRLQGYRMELGRTKS